VASAVSVLTASRLRYCEMKRSPESIDQLTATISALLDAPRMLANLERRVADLTDAVRSMENRLPSLLVSAEHAAKVWGSSPASVRRWAAEGVIPVVRLGRSLRVDLSKVRGIDRDDIARLAREARSR